MASRQMLRDVRRLRRMRERIQRIDFLLERGGRPDAEELKAERDARNAEITVLNRRIEKARTAEGNVVNNG